MDRVTARPASRVQTIGAVAVALVVQIVVSAVVATLAEMPLRNWQSIAPELAAIGFGAIAGAFAARAMVDRLFRSYDARIVFLAFAVIVGAALIGTLFVRGANVTALPTYVAGLATIIGAYLAFGKFTARRA